MARKPARGSGMWWRTPNDHTTSKLSARKGRSSTFACTRWQRGWARLLARATSTPPERSTPTVSAPGLVRHVEVAPEAAADVEHELSAERLDGERAAQVAAEVRAPLARELRPRRPEVEPLAGEALERVGERVVGRGRRRRQLGMAREEVRV